MAKFDYEKAFKNRILYPMTGVNRYIENGEIQRGDMWINHILKTLPENELVMVPRSFLALSSYKPERDKLFSIYYVNTLIDIGDYGTSNIRTPCAMMGISKTPTKKVKIACYEGRSIAKIGKMPEGLVTYFINFKDTPNKIIDEDDIKLLQSIPEPEYTEEFIAFLGSVQKWVETYTDTIDKKYFHREVKRSLIDNDRLLVRLYTDEATEYFKYIENERFVKLQDVADVFRGCNMLNKKQKGYEVKRLGVPHFTYPIDYSKLYINKIDYEVIYLQKGDIIVSALSLDGKLRVYLINEPLKEKISVVSSCYIIRAKKVSPEYLYLYLQSETAYKYVYYNNPLLSVNLAVIRSIPVALPSEKMEKVAGFALCAANPDGRIINLDMINEIIRGNYKIDRSEKPFQSLLLEEILDNIKNEKKDLVQGVITSDSIELNDCYNIGAYKACLILCGSILETVLLDWLSEIENTNYFVDDCNMQIDLAGVIERLKGLFYPDWNAEASKAHDVRVMRNLVHPVKCVVKQPEISKEVCLQIIEKLQDILSSRGIATKC